MPQMASSFVFLLATIPAWSFSAKPILFGDYPLATAPTTWTNSPSLRQTTSPTEDGSNVRSIVLRSNPGGIGPSFAAGFHCFSPCKIYLFSVFIGNVNSGAGILRFPPPQVIWSANRAHPVSENATLELASHSGLTLRDNDGSLVWSTDVANRSVAGINVTETGNLVLFDINNSTIWQSFDHPTDTLVLGQKLAQGMRLNASINPTNWTESRLYLTLLADGLYGLVYSNPPQIYFQRGISDNNITGNKSAYIEFMNGSVAVASNSPENYIFTMPEAVSVQFMRLEWDGHLRLYDFIQSSWKEVADLMNIDNCAYPTVCGDYGICSYKQYCSCPPGNYFMAVDSRQGNLGCKLLTPISCTEKNNHELITLNNTIYFNYIDYRSMFTIDLESCKQSCLRNCSCKAAFFLYYENSSSGHCSLQSEVFSLENNQPEVTHYNALAYLKVQLTPSPPPYNSSSKGKTWSGAFLGFTLGGAVVVLGIIVLFVMWLRRGREEQEEDGIDQLPGMPTRFTFKELQVATENFARKLGEGGFGTVFEGHSGDERIAVKRLENIRHGKKDFLAEVETIGSIHHINLVRLIGFCADKMNRMLVYEYMCNGSLDKWIYCSEERDPLNWSTRYKIITAIAKGLCYLHEECRQKVLHLDIKPANILLDEKFNAKISDFGLSKLIDRDKSRVMVGMQGTPGYLAPEWQTSIITEKVDVYSFGVVLMEILCGRRNLDYSQKEENLHLIKLMEEKAKRNQLLDLIDKSLADIKFYEEEIMNALKLAMWCLQWDCTRRPSMLTVVKVLERVMEVEPSLDYNFVYSIPMVTNSVGQVVQSDPLLASVLSGPR
ncbi:Serine/threonine-protein kinase [Rhynchospora pubera]|uniref:Receptor-like serine/threonine-protein kinase n=1 Tax=Rhynchospora pubera TaxID=906938 RepID=A0AAV8EK03_9POAL|nr:Serine/threonine-protein kinase [Rhynchospora pubera]